MVNCEICGSVASLLMSRADVSLSRYGLQEKPLTKHVSDTPLCIDIYHCIACKHSWNEAFDIRLVNYQTGHIIESGVFSKKYLAYQKAQAEKLNQIIDSEKDGVCELGAGSGIFLNNLNAKFKIAFEPSTERYSINKSVDVIADYFDESAREFDCNIIVCRQVLEHVPDPDQFIKLISSKNNSKKFKAYFEVPNGYRSLSDRRYFDFYYEHRSYFSVNSLSRLFINNNYVICSIGLDQSGEVIEALVELDLTKTVQKFAREEEKYADLIELANSYERPMIWGVAGNGSAFAEFAGNNCKINSVIDSDVSKQHRFLTNSNIKVISPEHAASIGPDLIIIASQFHKSEIETNAKLMFPDCKTVFL